MDRSEIFDKIAEVAADVLGVDVAEISEETTFDDLDANSLERLQLVTAIEDEFNLDTDDEPLLPLHSAADTVHAIEAAQEDYVFALPDRLTRPQVILGHEFNNIVLLPHALTPPSTV